MLAKGLRNLLCRGLGFTFSFTFSERSVLEHLGGLCANMMALNPRTRRSSEKIIAVQHVLQDLVHAGYDVACSHLDPMVSFEKAPVELGPSKFNGNKQHESHEKEKGERERERAR